MSDIMVEDLVEILNKTHWNNPLIFNNIVEKLGKVDPTLRNEDFPILMSILEEIEISMETAEHWLKDITIDTTISNIPSLLYSALCEKIKNNQYENINQKEIKEELIKLKILNINNFDSKQNVELEDPSDFFLKVISNIEDTFNSKISIENIIIRNEWHTQIELTRINEENNNSDSSNFSDSSEDNNDLDILSDKIFTIHVLYISKELIPDPKNKNDSIVIIMESFLLNKNDYFISNSYSIDNSLIYDIDKEQWKTTSIIKSELVIDSFMKKIEVLLTELFNYIYEFDDKNELNENIEESENYSLVPIENIHSSIINLLMPTPCSPSPFDKKKSF